MNTNLALANNAPPSASEWTVIREQSQMLLKSGFLPQAIKTPEQALAIILQGRELGIPTMAALGTINVIQGKPTVSPQLMLALINRSGQLENIEITGDDNGINCTMKRKGRSPHSEFFGAKEAAAMNLSGKDNYKKQAATMYRWRAVAACARTVFPDVILGLYLPDEMGADNVNSEGELITEPDNIRQMPKPQIVEKENPLNKQIFNLCGTLNDEKDSILWKKGTLSDYACELFGLESFEEMDDEKRGFLIEDLQARLDQIREAAAIQDENVIEAEITE